MDIYKVKMSPIISPRDPVRSPRDFSVPLNESHGLLFMSPRAPLVSPRNLTLINNIVYKDLNNYGYMIVEYLKSNEILVERKGKIFKCLIIKEEDDCSNVKLYDFLETKDNIYIIIEQE